MRPSASTFFQLHGKQVQLLHSLLQLVLGGGRHGIDVIVAAVVVFVGVSGEDLNAGFIGQRSGPVWLNVSHSSDLTERVTFVFKCQKIVHII